VLVITPDATLECRGSDLAFDVTIIGQAFRSPVQAWLGDRTWDISVAISDSNVTSTTIPGTVSPNIPPNVYGLTVQNEDTQTGRLSPAFTVYARPHPTTTFGSDDAHVTIFGPGAGTDEGDDDHMQIIFFEVPDTAPDVYYIHIFDADTGGDNDEEKGGSFGDTVMTYTVRGGAGAYTHPHARSAHPDAAGIGSGEQLIAQRVISEDVTLDDGWLTLPISRTQGEQVEGVRIFKLVVEGKEGDDGNWYEVAFSADVDNNVAVTNSRVFAFSWCLVLPNPSDDAVPLYPYVPSGTSTVTQFNFDFRNSGGITLTTPLRDLVVSPGGISGSGVSASESFTTDEGETGTTWSARYLSDWQPTRNVITVWFTGDGTELPIFTSPTMPIPPAPD